MTLSILIFSVVLFFLIGIAAYWVALDESQEVLDRQMQEMANFLNTHNVTLQSSQYDVKHKYDETDIFIDIVPKAELENPVHKPDFLLSYMSSPKFAKIHSSRGELKVYVLPLADKQIQISQLIKVRRHLAKQLALNMLIPYVLFMPFAMYGVYRLIRHHLKPLDDLKKAFAIRNYSDLSEVRIENLPAEIKPAINELNYLFNRIEQAQNHQKMFVANAAHELRTPLTAITLQLSLLEKTPQSDALYHENLDDLQQSLKRMTHLVEQLMSLAHHEVQGKIILEPVNLIEMARQCVGQLWANARKKGIDIQVVLADELNELYIKATPSILETILLNILDNAIKYNPEQGKVLIVIHQQGQFAYVDIHDNGKGISSEYYNHVLERFVRLPETQHQAMGSGLGLSIVKTALEQINAQMELKPSTQLQGLQVSLVFLLA